MKREEVVRVVRDVAHKLARDGEAQYDHFIVNPMRVRWTLLRSRPDIYRHIERYYPGDIYQQLKVWVPRSAS